jgi:hypothetical protein
MSDNLPAEIVAEARALKIADELLLKKAADIRARSIKYILKIGAELDPKISAAHKAHKLLVAEKNARVSQYMQAGQIASDAIRAYNSLKVREAAALSAELTARAKAQAEEAIIHEAVALESAGAPEAGDALLAAPIEPVATYVMPDIPKIEGLSVSERWHAEVVDLLALVKAVAEGRAAITFLEPNMPALNKQAQSLKRAMNLPGVKAVPETTISQRRT